MEKRGNRGEGISQGAGPPASLLQHTGVWFTSNSLAMHLGPNGERCQDELGQHWRREHLHPWKEKSVAPKKQPFCTRIAPPRQESSPSLSLLRFISL